MSSSRGTVVALLAFVAIGAIIDGVVAKPPSKIIGGGLVADDKFSFIVGLALSSNKGLVCGGSIIGPRHILTAGHCVENRSPGDLIVRSGIRNLNDTDDNAVNVQRIITHPQYRRKSIHLANDLAIVVLERDLSFGERVTKIELTNEQANQHKFSSDKIYYAAGWGITYKDSETLNNELKLINVSLTYAIECQGIYTKVVELLCGYSRTGAACSGDSGGPLIGDGKLVGVISAAQCEERKRDIYVNVYHYRDWINENIQ